MAKGKESDPEGRRGGRKRSVRGEFVQIFKEHPALLGNRNNDDITSLWLELHPEHKDMPRNVRNTLANVKSQLRKKDRSQKAVASDGEARRHFMGPFDIETLEIRIDEALTLARSLDPEGLESVIRLLRRARNEVVWKLGQ